MSHPSIRARLMAGTGVFVALVLAVSLVVIYQSISRMLRKEVRVQLIQSASILSKSAELEPDGPVYEWNEALESDANASISGLFQFWDLNSGNSVGSPALEGGALEMFHGDLDQPVLRAITLPDGRPAMAVGLKHLPFLDAAGVVEMEQAGTVLRPADFPQVLVCARETASIDAKLSRMRFHLVRAGVATLFAIWLSIFLITRWTMRPIRELAENFDERSKQESGGVAGIPDELPIELRGLAEAFNRSLSRVEAGRDRERDFALHAAHELRTPVAGIQATLEQALKRDRTADDLRERIGRALGVTGEMREVIGSLMKIARARGRLEKPVIKHFEAAAELRGLVDAENPRFRERGLSVSWDEAGDDSLRSDPELFAVVIRTLLDNVVHHAPADSEVGISLDGEGDQLVVSIDNDSPDLGAGDLARLLEPFQRGRDQVGEGAGLGLSLAREITLLLGGSLNLELAGGRLSVMLALPRGSVDAGGDE